MKNLNLIRSVAWSFAKKTGYEIEFDDLMGEASLAYCEALQSWDCEKSKLSIYAYHCMRNRLINFCKREHKWSSHKADYKLTDDGYSSVYIEQISSFKEHTGPNEYPSFWEIIDGYTDYSMVLTAADLDETDKAAYLSHNFNLDDFCEGWPEEQRALAEMLIEDPEKFLGKTPNMKRDGGIKARISKELRNQGWMWKEIQMAFDEMKTQLQTT